MKTVILSLLFVISLAAATAQQDTVKVVIKVQQSLKATPPIARYDTIYVQNEAEDTEAIVTRIVYEQVSNVNPILFMNAYRVSQPVNINTWRTTEDIYLDENKKRIKGYDILYVVNEAWIVPFVEE